MSKKIVIRLDQEEVSILKLMIQNQARSVNDLLSRNLLESDALWIRSLKEYEANINPNIRT